jgi:hypothetical protein
MKSCALVGFVFATFGGGSFLLRNSIKIYVYNERLLHFSCSFYKKTKAT